MDHLPYIYCMGPSAYQILLIIHDIVHTDPQPLTYPCRPRELILRCMQDWSSIQEELSLLENEGLVTTQQLDTLVIHITQEGLDRVRTRREEAKAG